MLRHEHGARVVPHDRVSDIQTYDEALRRVELDDGKNWASDFPSRWKLDAAKGVASLEKPTDALKALTIPIDYKLNANEAGMVLGWHPDILLVPRFAPAK